MRLAAALILALLPALAHAQSLWGSTSAGMSLDQVRAAVAGVVEPGKPNTLRDGRVERLQLPAVDVIGERFRASFYFNGDVLSEVHLSPAIDFTGDRGRTFGELLDSLRSRYGAEFSREVKGGLAPSRVHTWIAGRTRITAAFVELGNNKDILQLIYAAVRPADNL